MGRDEESPDPMYVATELLEEIFLRLPLNSILRFKAVSKLWRSILESRSFADKRIKFQKKPKILAVAANHQTEAKFDGDEDVDVVYLHCDVAATKPSLSCEGLVCLPLPGCVNVLNPTTGESISFPTAPDLVVPEMIDFWPRHSYWKNKFPGQAVMGFGKDIVSGRYKVVRMLFEPYPFDPECRILDVDIGEWRELDPPRVAMDELRKSAYVNGSIYWLEIRGPLVVIALDLDTEMFRELPDLPYPARGYLEDQLVNFQDRVAISRFAHYTFQILSMDAQEENWSMIYSVGLLPSEVSWKLLWLRPLVVTDRGDIIFHDSKKRLFRYCKETDHVTILHSDVCVLSPFVENLVSLRPSSSSSSGTRHQAGLRCFEPRSHMPDARVSETSEPPRIQKKSVLGLPKILFAPAVTLVALFLFGHFVVSSRSRR